MMHHPNMHHQPMSGHPPQHMPGHQGMPGHHQMPPHQLHRESRHVPLTRVPLGPSQAGGMGPGQAMGGMGVPHHPPSHRPPHAIRAMPHHPPTHHSVPPQMKAMRRYAYGPGGAGVLRPPYALPPHVPPAPPVPPLSHAPLHPTIPPTLTTVNASVKTNAAITSIPSAQASAAVPVEGERQGGDVAGAAVTVAEGEGAGGEGEAARAPAQANSKEKTPMCLVNELARYNKVKHQYRLTSETGPAHKKVFTVTLRLGDTEEYTAEGTSIKRAQHAAAGAALAGTRYPPPPPRVAPHHHHHPHHRNAGAVMPTVELNALAMKVCQPALYTSLPPIVTSARGRGRGGGGLCAGGGRPRLDAPDLVYRVRVSVGGRAWLGAGDTPQAARHDAAARALHDLRPRLPELADDADADATLTNTAEASADLLNSEVKSPVSLVHELALKRNLSVHFSVKSERGPPHMRVFVTVCSVGEMETEGEGNGKKVSKRRAASHMLEEMRARWPPAALRARTEPAVRRANTNKKKPRNLIKENAEGVAGGGGGGGGGAGGGAGGEGEGGADNPISRLAAARHAARARSPQYRVVEERGAARRREFLVRCEAPPHAATGAGPNKKTAKRRAAHNVLLAMELEANAVPTNGSPVPVDSPVLGEGKRKEGASGGETRQPVPGVLLMDYHSRSGQPHHNGVSEPSTGGGNTPGAKAHLMYLSQLLGFTVQFSDFPKRNHGEYLSLVSLSTEPPVICHGAGSSTEHSHELSAQHALGTLALMGLDLPAPASSPAHTLPNTATLPGPAGKPSAITNGITE